MQSSDLRSGMKITGENGVTYVIETVARREDVDENVAHGMKHACLIAYVRIRRQRGTKQFFGHVRDDGTMHVVDSRVWHGDPWFVNCPDCGGDTAGCPSCRYGKITRIQKYAIEDRLS